MYAFNPWSMLLFSCQVMSNSLRPHGLQHTRLPFPSSPPGGWPSSCPLNWWCHPTISSSVVLFSFCLQSFLASGSFPGSQLFTSGSQSIGASASVLPMSIQVWFPLGLTGLISLLSKGLSRVFSPQFKSISSRCSAFFMVQLPHRYMIIWKTTALTIQTFTGKVMSLLFNTLSRFVIAFLPRSNCLLISGCSHHPVILEPKKKKFVTASTWSISSS